MPFLRIIEITTLSQVKLNDLEISNEDYHADERIRHTGNY